MNEGNANSKEKAQMNRKTARPSFTRHGLLGTFAIIAALLAATIAAAPAAADFGLNEFDVTFTNEDGTPATQAGSHPFALEVSYELNSHQVTENPVTPGEFAPDGEIKDLIVENIVGLVGDVAVMPRCSGEDFLSEETLFKPDCPNNTAVGVAGAYIFSSPPSFWSPGAVFNLVPPPGAAARVGFSILGVRVAIDLGVKQGGEYNVTASLFGTSQAVIVFGGQLQLWGNPADPAHDALRGSCFAKGGFQNFVGGAVNFSAQSIGSCSGGTEVKPFLTLPGSCVGPVETTYQANSWQSPDAFNSGGIFTHDDAEPPNPIGFSGCGKLAYKPAIESKVTSDSAETGTGLDFNVNFNDEGLKNPTGIAQSTTRKAVITLPEGVTINPSVGEGLGVCTPADLDRETINSEPGEGCPNSSKIGSLHTEYPIIDQPVDGSIFLAQQDDPTTSEPRAENPFDSLIALYFVLRSTDLGVIVKLPVLVEPDSDTGQLVVTLDDIPQFPFSHFNAHMREGQRAALVTPPTCGKHTTVAKLYPWSEPDSPRTVLADFEITSGVGDGPCPPGGIPPFDPSFKAGSINNNAGSFSPFNMRLLREDGEQNMTKFSAILPPGVLGSLAGIEKCGDFAVAVAKEKTGREEQAAPSCPANSEIGSTLAGAGVGSALTYVPGKIYLSGPYKGAPLSVVAITPAVAGPFDAGTVAVRLGLTLNPKTAEVEVDGAASDPIPHILNGIVLKLRDLRVYVDRPNFILNPTSCDESSAKAMIFGSNVDVFNPADDVPANLSTRYQAANCLNLGFAPKLGLRLRGGTRRGAFPGLRAVYSPRQGDANVEGLVVRMPRSAFLEQGHIRTICTRVQFAADNCPKAAQYGYIKAWTPLLDEPLQGPVWLRSSNHKLPDLVFDLHGLVDVEVQTRIDSVNGGIRATVEDAPDAPLSRVILTMQGGKKGLIVNSRNLCTKRKARANARFDGQNGKRHTRRPVLPPRCGRKAKRSAHRRAQIAAASRVG